MCTESSEPRTHLVIVGVVRGCASRPGKQPPLQGQQAAGGARHRHRGRRRRALHGHRALHLWWVPTALISNLQPKLSYPQTFVRALPGFDPLGGAHLPRRSEQDDAIVGWLVQ